MPPNTRALGTRLLNPGGGFLDELYDTLPSFLRELAPELAPPESDSSVCLSEDEVLNFTAGQLEAAQLRRIDDHLGHCSICSRVVTDVLGELAGPTESYRQLPNVPCVFSPSTTVGGRFVIERLIGRGGMGEVYKAFDLKRQRSAAIKTVLAARCDDRRAMTRLAVELAATRKITHPNVCRALGTGVHLEGDLSFRFIVMDYIEGETLGQRSRRQGALPLPEALLVARQILLGLEAIHAAGVAHLDVKSDNVMLREGHEPRAVLIDFGLARATATGKAARRQHRSPAGTIWYMAPEQLSSQPVGPHTDVFGFGVVLYELLTGNHPFAARHASEVLARSSSSDELPLRPSQVAPMVLEGVDEFVAGCTRADPADRYPDASAALRHLDRLTS
jgi:serine/threonine protein kinase